MTAAASGEQAEDLAATMLASTLGLDFDPEAAWNERKQIYEHSSLIIDSTSITAAAVMRPGQSLDLRDRRCSFSVFLEGLALAKHALALSLSLAPSGRLSHRWPEERRLTKP